MRIQAMVGDFLSSTFARRLPKRQPQVATEWWHLFFTPMGPLLVKAIAMPVLLGLMLWSAHSYLVQARNLTRRAEDYEALRATASVRMAMADTGETRTSGSFRVYGPNGEACFNGSPMMFRGNVFSKFTISCDGYQVDSETGAVSKVQDAKPPPTPRL